MYSIVWRGRGTYVDGGSVFTVYTDDVCVCGFLGGYECLTATRGKPEVESHSNQSPCVARRAAERGADENEFEALWGVAVRLRSAVLGACHCTHSCAVFSLCCITAVNGRVTCLRRYLLELRSRRNCMIIDCGAVHVKGKD